MGHLRSQPPSLCLHSRSQPPRPACPTRRRLKLRCTLTSPHLTPQPTSPSSPHLTSPHLSPHPTSPQPSPHSILGQPSGGPRAPSDAEITNILQVGEKAAASWCDAPQAELAEWTPPPVRSHAPMELMRPHLLSTATSYEGRLGSQLRKNGERMSDGLKLIIHGSEGSKVTSLLHPCT
jgi:hypothetical protein